MRLSTPPRLVARANRRVRLAVSSAACPPSRHAYGQHRAEAPGHLRHCGGMSAVLRQSRIEHLLDGRDGAREIPLPAMLRRTACEPAAPALRCCASAASNRTAPAPRRRCAARPAGARAARGPRAPPPARSARRCDHRDTWCHCGCTRSTPKSKGRWQMGVAKVLSQTTSAPARWAMAVTASRSVMLSNGLVGVSIQTTRARPPTAVARCREVGEIGKLHRRRRDAYNVR